VQHQITTIRPQKSLRGYPAQQVKRHRAPRPLFNNTHREAILHSSKNDSEHARGMPVDPLQLSKFLSFVLRHQPNAIGLALDPEGWVSIDELVEKGNAQFIRDDLLHVVETSDKKRFSISLDGLRIRAAQGHSVSVELGFPPQEPPPSLYHGTATRFIDSALHEGLTPQHASKSICRSTR
jgi:RNA:NAD 2'-phosphotransferase (TPT1/KptA family)